MIKLYMNILLYVCAPISFITGTYLLFSTIFFINNSLLIKGKVTDFETTEIDTTTINYRPIIKYQINKKEYQSVSFTSADAPIYKKNDSLEILINKDNYNDLRINNFTELWYFPMLSYLLFLIFLIFPQIVARTKSQIKVK